MNVNDESVRLRHMLDAVNEVASFTHNRNQDDLSKNKMLLRALSMSIGIIGEAASHLDNEFRDRHSQIPWRQIIGMRNFLFHEYFKVDEKILWDTATQAVPALKPQLEQIIEELES